MVKLIKTAPCTYNNENKYKMLLLLKKGLPKIWQDPINNSDYILMSHLKDKVRALEKHLRKYTKEK